MSQMLMCHDKQLQFLRISNMSHRHTERHGTLCSRQAQYLKLMEQNEKTKQLVSLFPKVSRLVMVILQTKSYIFFLNFFLIIRIEFVNTSCQRMTWTWKSHYWNILYFPLKKTKHTHFTLTKKGTDVYPTTNPVIINFNINFVPHNIYKWSFQVASVK